MKLKICEDATQRLNDPSLPNVLSVKMVQSVLGIGRISVYRLIENKLISAFQIGRTYHIYRESVVSYLRAAKESEGSQ